MFVLFSSLWLVEIGWKHCNHPTTHHGDAHPTVFTAKFPNNSEPLRFFEGLPRGKRSIGADWGGGFLDDMCSSQCVLYLHLGWRLDKFQTKEQHCQNLSKRSHARHLSSFTYLLTSAIHKSSPNLIPKMCLMQQLCSWWIWAQRIESWNTRRMRVQGEAFLSFVCWFIKRIEYNETNHKPWS